MNNFRGEGRVVAICHATLCNLSPELDLGDWYCYIDETLDVFHPAELNLHDSHQLLTEHLKTISDGSPYSRLVSVNDTALTAIIENRDRDAYREIVAGTAEKIISPHYDCFTLQDKYRHLIERKGEKQKLYCLSVLHPRVVSAFGGVTVLSARFEESLHYHLWEREGVVWTQDAALSVRLRFTQHSGYEKTKIYWGLDRNFSKSFRDANADWYDEFIRAALDVVGTEGHVRLENNDIKNSSLLSKSLNGETIPGRAHGLNKYRNIDHAIIISAMNYSPVAGRFLSARYKFGSHKQAVSFACHNIYQAISRTSMRDGDMGRERLWVVPSRIHAEWLSQIFQGSSCISLALNQPSAGNLGRPELFNSPNDRKNHSKVISRNKARQISDFVDRIGVDMMENVTFFNSSDDDVSSLYNIDHFVANYRSSWFKIKYKRDAQVISMKEHKYISWLKKESTKSYAKKDDVPLVSPAFYNPLWVGKGKRGKKNVVFASGVMLDFDDTELGPDELAKIFTELQMVAYSTFSNSSTNLRYRAYLPTTCPMLIPEYNVITHAIIQAIESAGYRGKQKGAAKPNGSDSESESDRFTLGGNLKRHGIDMGKIGPYSIFHLPCRSPSGHSFFNHYSGPGRAPLDVNQWLSSLPPIEEPEAPSTPTNYSYVDEAHTLTDHQKNGVEYAMAEWFGTGTLPGKGNDAMWDLYERLRDLRLPIDLMWEQMSFAARSSNTPRDRLKQVDYLMNDLMQYRFMLPANRVA
ncbi:hypothetical protein [Methylobacterium sp. WL7]|uniref:hypothetical protein n=1 Tax=Methylobacterium sp. WL7 TaxID=2603900 RepID=UPI0011CC3CE5|nr:hypothetical protein [Methylobacterium sp. WL7]TXN44848.1 hypothetical protein FV233_13430 [Methylobacterium sp. WL7]